MSRARVNRQLGSVRVAAIHCEPAAMEGVVRRNEDKEVQPGGSLLAEAVPLGSRSPGEWVVERVEVRTLWNGRALRVDHPVVVDDLLGQSRCRLDRGAVPRETVSPDVVLQVVLRLRVLRPLRNRLRPYGHLESGTKGRCHPLVVVEARVPRLEVLKEMREMHRRPVPE